MTVITFYEKTGCTSNARQKALLTASGHEVRARDLRHVRWSNMALLDFLGGVPVSQWFNGQAPSIVSGEIVPEELDEPTALALMRENPLLIRRPLLKVGDECRVGFDAAAIRAWIGLREVPEKNLEVCRRAAAPAPEPEFYVQTAGGGAYPCHFSASSDADLSKPA